MILTQSSLDIPASAPGSLTHWGRVTHICGGKLIIIGSDNGLSPGRRQAIIRTNAGILLIGPLRTNFSEISIEIRTFSFKKMRLKVASAKWRPFCLGLNVLNTNFTEAACWRWCDIHDDVIKWRYLPRYWPFLQGIHRSPVNSPHKGQWRGALMWNGWVHNRHAGDLRRHRTHCDATLMELIIW